MRMNVQMCRVGVLAALGLSMGCATETKIVFDKSGVSATQRQQDENTCLRETIGIDPEGRLFAPFTVDRGAYEKCMQARGYAAVRR